VHSRENVDERDDVALRNGRARRRSRGDARDARVMGA